MSGGSGLLGGLAGSLIAPWSRWGVEKRRLRHDRRSELVAEWRAGIDVLRAAEDAAAPRIPFPARGEHPAGYLVIRDGLPDPPETRAAGQSWYRTLQLYLSRDARRALRELEGKGITARHGKVPDILSAEVARIERDWKLI